MRRPPRIVIIGAGAGGLAAACDHAREGLDVVVIERAAAEGGKMRQVEVNGARIDAGPTVFTMRWVFEQLFADAGQSFGSAVSLTPAHLLARHGWTDGSRLDLHADVDTSVEEISRFAGAGEARAFRQFMSDCRSVHDTLQHTFMAAQKPGPVSLALRVGNLSRLLTLRPFDRYWDVLKRTFSDARLQQLFGRYSTYVGSSPFLAPATLMLIAHVEQQGVWIPEGGMHGVAQAMRRLAESQGARFRFGEEASEVLLENSRTSAVRLKGGEVIPADAVIFNGDTNALASGLLGAPASRAAGSMAPAPRSLSAATWCARAKAEGFPLAYHSVLFGPDYRGEFDAIFRERSISRMPTVYICAQDRVQSQAAEGPERLLILVNAPAMSDLRADDAASARDAALRTMQACGLDIAGGLSPAVQTAPQDFDALFPGSAGALYGAANHSPFASFTRPGAASAIPGLYFAGGSAHPGPGVPMATLSGRLAAERLLADLSG